ncbi:MAG TPA: hypothetical protein VGW34_01785 [Allosphingosinicella sp.]|nr:hypothetical protein [Allosphingosinicella sp.]
MAHPLTLPTVAMLALAGTGLGVHLGRAAIDEINPLYFSMPQATQSYAALTPHKSDDSAPPARDISAVEYGAALGRGCIGCGAYPEEYRPRRDPDLDAYLARSWAPEEAPTLEQAVVQVRQYAEAADEERRLIEAYSRYPVTAEELRLHEQAIEAAVESRTEPQLEPERDGEPEPEREGEPEPEPVGL